MPLLWRQRRLLVSTLKEPWGARVPLRRQADGGGHARKPYQRVRGLRPVRPFLNGGGRVSAGALALIEDAASHPRLRILCEREGPEPLRRRCVFAPPSFLVTCEGG
jgi:hypothetical protein